MFLMYFLAILPILLLIVFSLTKGVKPAVIAGFLVTTIIFFFWGATIAQFLATIGVSLVTTLNILMIIFGAAFLYNIMFKAGMIEQISHSLDNLHPSREIRFFLLAICLTAFFEGVAGFGTPGAIVPLLLMALGYEAALSVSVVLLFDAFFALFGAVGTPIITGLQFPLDLPSHQIQEVGIISAGIGVLVQLVIIFFIFRLFKQYNYQLLHKGKILLLFSFFAIPFCLFAYFITELATVLASLVMSVCSILFLKYSQGPLSPKKLELKAWIPYAILAFLLLLPKFFEPLRRWIGWELAFPEMFGTTLDAAIKPLQSPLIPFLIVGIGVNLLKKGRSFYLMEPLKKSANVFVILFPSIAVAQLMINSGVSQPSMITYLSEMFSLLGIVYVFFAPFMGIMGTFITGSTTISNVVLGPSQLETASSILVHPTLILSMQHVGAALGNAICLFNIIAAAAIANLQNYKDVLSKNLLPTLVGGLLTGILGYIILLIFY
ncbi:L-lactate permease [soil metagenome]